MDTHGAPLPLGGEARGYGLRLQQRDSPAASALTQLLLPEGSAELLRACDGRRRGADAGGAI
eukprot:2267902-Prymnesium_polylepis.1